MDLAERMSNRSFLDGLGRGREDVDTDVDRNAVSGSLVVWSSD
jgi:hypothetical protein